MVINAKSLIIELKSFTILTSIKQSFVLLISTVLENVSMEIIVLLPIQNQKFLLSWLIGLIKTLISICFISRQFGVHTMKLIIKEIYVSIHITGKITDVNHSFIIMLKINVLIGDLDHSLIITKMAVPKSIIV